MINMKKMIWEGWTVGDFVEDLKPELDMIMSGNAITRPFKTKKELEKWCSDNQPYYKKKIPEVVSYFCDRYGL